MQTKQKNIIRDQRIRYVRECPMDSGTSQYLSGREYAMCRYSGIFEIYDRDTCRDCEKSDDESCLSYVEEVSNDRDKLEARLLRMFIQELEGEEYEESF